MSYLIQNFTHTNYSMRLNLRSRAAFILRNIFLIYNLLIAPSKIINMLASNKYLWRQIRFIGSNFFSKLIKILFPKPRFVRYVPIGTNFARSAHRQSLQNLDLLLQNQTLPLQLPSPALAARQYPYFTGFSLSITPVAKKPFSLTLYKLLRMSLGVWFSWSRTYNLSVHYSNIHTQWLFLKFLNKYFFKVYNV